ncbi:MAG TPA: Ig-like domain-containing protein, partial [Gemmatimonadales bacterium]
MAHPARRARRQAQGPRLRLTPAVFGLAALAACASQGEPPGGPPDVTPPVVLAVRPESGAVIPNLSGDAVIQFDDVIDEMPTTTGTGLANLVLLSPVAGPVDVSWHRRAIAIHPKEGWKPGRVYHLELLPGVSDLRRNITKRGRTLVFSTGPALPHASLTGLAVMWVEQRPLVHGVIRAVLKPDTIGYLAVTDSSGAFHLDDIPPGRYVVYAIDDQNKNRAQDRHEAYDSSVVSLDSTASADLWAFTHDTLGPRAKATEPVDSVSIRVEFTQALDVSDHVDTSRVHLFQMPDSVPVPVTAVLSPAANDSLVAKLRAAADSARKAA